MQTKCSLGHLVDESVSSLHDEDVVYRIRKRLIIVKDPHLK